MFLKACGRITNLNESPLLNPKLLVASVCPLSTEAIPPLIISQTYAALFNVTAMIPAISEGMLMITPNPK